MSNSTHYNRLRNESSLYLKQHAEQPVHWFSWGPEALLAAKEENKPIFLSVGYSSCHWCHVMSRESFENAEIANYLNEHFIAIKVDREEMPDIDQYYQQACQLYTQSGGWPLSAFLLPDTRPFFVGTYFKPVSEEKSTGLLDLLKELHRAFTQEQGKILENADQVSKMIQEGQLPKERVEFQGHFPAPMAVMKAIDQFFDKENGGYGKAPKFPNFPFWEWALEQMLEGMIEKEYGEKIVMSLERLLMGGIFDQARGGLHRYATDAEWGVPHFEKMLYDQAGLLRVLSKLSLLYPSPLVYDAMINTLDYLETEMVSEKNYFFSGQDAESEGVEGLYFCYTKEEFEDALNRFDDQEETLAKNKEKLLEFFKITQKGNYDHCLNVLTLNEKMKKEIFAPEGFDLLRKARRALADERKLRIPPATDAKGVASWNFMMITSLVDVLQYCQVDVIREMASKLFNQCLAGAYEQFIDQQGGKGVRIRHTNTREVTLPYFEDMVFFAEMQLRVYEVTGNEVFKNNFKESMQYLEKEFVQDHQALTRAKLANEFEQYPNLRVSCFDSSYRSPLSTFIGLARRGRALFQDAEFMGTIEALQDALTHDGLKNPIPAGEALRALTYPDQAYRLVKIPLHWLKQEKFIRFLPYFLPRFVMDYHGKLDDASPDETWEICRVTECELKGVGLDEFILTLTPPKPEAGA